MKLTGSVLADIFLGKIKKWNDPAIAALNQGVNEQQKSFTAEHAE